MHTTEFTGGTMKHAFKNGFEIVVDFKKSIISTLKNGKLIKTLSFEKEAYSLADFENLLIVVGNISNY